MSSEVTADSDMVVEDNVQPLNLFHKQERPESESTLPEISTTPPISRTVLNKFYKLDSEACKSRSNRNCANNARCIKGLGQPSWLTNDELEEPKLDDENLINEDRFCFRGLKNLGATCYINTFLQLWFHNVNLRKSIYEWRPNDNTSNSIQNNPISCLQLILSMMQFSARRFVDPSPFIKCLQLDESQEQDTHEFSSLFNSYIQNKLNYQNDKSIQNTINREYCMKIAYIIKCNNCSIISERESDFYELLLRVKGFKDIEECIFDYLKEESLEGNNRYACQICDGLQDAKRFIELRKLPPVLNLQLLRCESTNGVSKKISSFLKFPKRLDMSKFVKSGGNHIYNLSAALIHEGQTAYSGHYITFIKKDAFWFKFNDETVEKHKDFNLKIDNDDFIFQEKKPGNDKGFHKSKNVYMLVYKLETEHECKISDNLPDCGLPDYIQDYIQNDNNKYLREQEELLHRKSIQRMDEVKHQRQMKQINMQMKTTGPPEHDNETTVFDAINKNWLVEFFKANIPNEVPEINNSSLLCFHNKLDIDSSFKCISKDSADLIYSLYKYDVRLELPKYFCMDCVAYRLYMDKLKQEIDNDSKEISNLLKFKNSQDEMMFWVGKNSFKKWKFIKLDSVKKQFNDQNEHNNKSDDEEAMDFNDDLLCPHRKLCSDTSKRRLIRFAVWKILRKHFPGCMEFAEDSAPCFECLELDKTKQIIRDKNFGIALMQRSSLNNLYNGDLCRYWSDLAINQVYHIISTKFYVVWKKFLSHPNTSPSPVSLTDYEDNLVCHSHMKFLFAPFDNDYIGFDKNYLILDSNEWNILTNFYGFNTDITIMVLENDVEITPEFCQPCFLNYAQEIKQKRFIYDEVVIYVRKMVSESNVSSSTNNDDNDNPNNDYNEIKRFKTDDSSNNNNENDDKKARATKRNLRKRRTTNELPITVSSSNKLKDIKFKIMQHFNIATYDQVLFYNDRQLTSQQNNCTLSQLEIEPYSTLKLWVDDAVDWNEICDESPVDSNLRSKAGFKGTQLQLL